MRAPTRLDSSDHPSNNRCWRV